MDMNFILKKLAEGKTADDLAKEFTDALNAANAEIKRQEEEKIKAKSVKIDRLAKIVEDIVSYVLDYYADVLPNDILDELNGSSPESYAKSAEEIDALIEEIVPSLPMLIKLAELQDSLGGASIMKAPSIKLAAAPVKRPQKPTVKTLSDDEANDILSQFLKDLSTF